MTDSPNEPGEVRCPECKAPTWKGAQAHTPSCSRFGEAPTTKPAQMDAPDGPICGCGKPSAYQSGLCAECGATTKPEAPSVPEGMRERARLICKLNGCESCQEDDPAVRCYDRLRIMAHA